MKTLKSKARTARVTPLDHLRAIAAQIYRNGSKTDADAILGRVQEAEAERAALVAVAEAAEAHQASMPGEELSNWAILQDALKHLVDVRAKSEVAK